MTTEQTKNIWNNSFIYTVLLSLKWMCFHSNQQVLFEHIYLNTYLSSLSSATTTTAPPPQRQQRKLLTKLYRCLRTIQYLHRCLETKDSLSHLGNEGRHTFQTFLWRHRWRHVIGYQNWGWIPIFLLLFTSFWYQSNKISIFDKWHSKIMTLQIYF